MVEVKIFNGKLNKDNSEYRLPPNDFTDALNISRNNTEIVHNLNGNVLVANSYLYTAGGAVNKEIGRREDITRNRVYYFVWNSLNYHLICYYDAGLDTIVKVLKNLTDTGGIDILGWNPSYRINHIDIIYRDDDGDLVSFTDGYTTPKCANVKRLINGDYPVVKKAFIEQAKKPFLKPLTAVYGNDATRNSNSLKKSIFQFAARPTYDDFQKATFAEYSKIPLPIGYYGSDNDLDNTKNNFITLTVETGDIDVATIEIAMRQNIGNVWGDFVQVAKLNKAELSIPDNSTYQYLFYNDAVYPPIDINEILPLFNYVPPLAGTQCLGNGAIPVYGDITEGFNNYPSNLLDVTITAANQTNIPPDADPTSITYTVVSNTIQFVVRGAVPTGTVYKIYIFFNGNPGIGQTYGTRLVGNYTSILGDTTTDVATALYNQFNSYSSVPIMICNHTGPNFSATFGVAGNYTQSIQVTAGSLAAGTISTEKTWLWGSNYVLGLAYKDEQGRIMPGVTTSINPTVTDKDFLVTTPTISFDGSLNVKTPVISAAINHLPPVGAVSYAWVRRRLNFGTFLNYIICDYQDPSDGYLYFCLANIDLYKSKNSQFIYGSVPIATDSRLKIMANYAGTIYNYDYEILGTVTRTATGGASPANDALFIKVKKPVAAISPAYTTDMLVMVYTPALNPTSLADSVFYEWGEEYSIYTLSSVNYHRGKDRDQTASQSATFTFTEGDVYFHKRNMFASIVSPGAGVTYNIMDSNYSDFYNSAVNDNGRALVIEVNARQQRNPVLVRFGGAYEAGTNINKINTFLALNYDEYSRDFGIIRKLFIEGRRMFVFQQFETGVVPIYTQIIKDTSGNPLEANSDQLLNKIAYPYGGKHGIGDTPESFAYSSGNKYFMDSNLGMPIRIGQNGAEELSVVYQMNSFFIDQLAAYGKGLDNGIAATGTVYMGNPTVYGGFDNKDNKYIAAFEVINRYSNPSTLSFHQDAFTISFFETRGEMQGFESFLSYQPEGVVSLNNLLISFKNGNLWRHNNPLFNNFYGVQYDSSITGVFNKAILDKKTFTNIEEIASEAWGCPEIVTGSDEYGTTKQTSNLVVSDFEKLESNFNTAFYGATNSIGGLVNGSSLKGNYCTIKFRAIVPSDTNNKLVTLASITVKSINSPLNVKQ